MTVKVVSGVARGIEPGSSTESIIKQASAPATQVSTAHGASNAVLSDASVVCLRCSRSNAPAERIVNEPEAKTVAKDVADRIEREEEGVDAHKLDTLSSAQHLAQQH